MQYSLEERQALVPSVAELTSFADEELQYLERNRKRKQRLLMSKLQQSDVLEPKMQHNFAYLPDLARVPIGIPHLTLFMPNASIMDESILKLYDLQSFKYVIRVIEAPNCYADVAQ